MPYGRCPVCGTSYHMSVSLPLDDWYHRYWPGVPVGSEVPGKCPQCWVPLRVGHQVTVRAVPAPLAGVVAVGTTGVVAAIESGAELLFLVELPDAAVPAGRFGRGELFWVPGQPPIRETPDAEPSTAADRGPQSS